VNELKEFETHKLPQLSNGYWDPQVCLKFTSYVLQFLKTIVGKFVEKDFDRKTLRLRFSPTSQSIELLWIENNDGNEKVNEKVNERDDEQHLKKKQKIS